MALPGASSIFLQGAWHPKALANFTPMTPRPPRPTMRTLSPVLGELGGHGRPGEVVWGGWFHPESMVSRYLWLVVAANPSEKWWTSSLGMMTFPIYGKIKNVPNHQPKDVYTEIGDECHHPPIRWYWTLIMSDCVDWDHLRFTRRSRREPRPCVWKYTLQ